MVMYLEQGLTTLVMLFVIASIVLICVDITKAKKEKRKVKLWIKIMFIISVIAIIFIIFVAVLIFGFLTYAFFPR